MTTITQAKKLTGSTGTTSSVTITAPAAGNALLVCVVVLTSAAPASPATALTDNLGNTYTLDFASSSVYSIKHYYYRKKNFSNAPTTLSFTCSASTSAYFAWVEVDSASVDSFDSSFDVLLSGGASQSTHTLSYTVPTPNSFLFFDLGTSTGRLLNSASNGFTVVQTETTSPPHAFYKANAASGSDSTLLTLSAATSVEGVGTTYKPLKPAVTSVSSPTTAEGSNITFSVALASATSGTTYYSGALSNGTADVLIDLSSTLATATLTNGVTFSAGSFSVPSAVSGWDVTLATAPDTLDEVNETFTLTVDGTVGTGTITDDDAPPTISVTDASENAMQVVFTVSLSQASGKSITVDYATADGTKTAGTDYTAASGTLTFAAGETEKTVTVAVL